MRLPVLPSLLLSSLGLLLRADTTIADASNASLPEVPLCAPCLEAAALNSTCLLGDMACYCLDDAFQQAAGECIKQSCSIVQDMLDTVNATSTACSVPVRDEGWEFDQLTYLTMLMSGLVVLLRITQQAVTKTGFHAEDILLIAAYLLAIPEAAININYLTPNGLGRNIWTLTYEQISSLFKFIFILQNIYWVQLFILKISFLLFYLRIFQTNGVRRLLWSSVGFCVAVIITFLFLGIFQCHPIESYWENWDRLHGGKCLDIWAISYANASFSIAVDVWLLAMPLFQLTKLQLHWKKKIWIALMFAVGAFVTAVSIIRLWHIIQLSRGTNPSWDGLHLAWWSFLELHMTILCVCMPSLRLLLEYLFPTWLGPASVRPETAGYGGGGGRGGTRRRGSMFPMKSGSSTWGGGGLLRDGASPEDNMTPRDSATSRRSLRGGKGEDLERGGSIGSASVGGGWGGPETYRRIVMSQEFRVEYEDASAAVGEGEEDRGAGGGDGEPGRSGRCSSDARAILAGFGSDAVQVIELQGGSGQVKSFVLRAAGIGGAQFPHPGDGPWGGPAAGNSGQGALAGRRSDEGRPSQRPSSEGRSFDWMSSERMAWRSSERNGRRGPGGGG